MLNRQDMRVARLITVFTSFFLLPIIFTACQAAEPPVSTKTPFQDPSISQSLPQTTLVSPVISPTPQKQTTDIVNQCNSKKGIVERKHLNSKKLPGDLYFSIYLPPCYTDSESYPVLYLLHGITYTDDQWIRLGALEIVDEYISSGVSDPVIMVFPYNPNPQRPPDSNFGEALVQDLIPYIDANFATCSDADCRMIGGISRGGGWAWDIFLDYPQLFGSVAGHSPALFQRIPSLLVLRLEGLLQGQRLWFDVGEQDPELNYLSKVHDAMDQAGIEHEFHVFPGTHTEDYWKANIPEYLMWYLGSYSSP